MSDDRPTSDELPTEATLPGKTAPRTDVANSEALVSLYGEGLRFVGTWGKWLAWDSRRWLVDDVNAAQERAVETARVLLAEGAESFKAGKAEGDEFVMKEAQRNIAWAVSSQFRKGITAMVALAKSKSSIAVRHQELDAHPMLLNVLNGTIDLTTGAIGPYNRSNLITKLAPVDYDPDAKCPTWDAFLDRVMGGDAELIAFLQRAIGYALTGDIREHVLLFFFGAGANGKSTFLSTIHAMLGDYATPAPRGLLMRSHGPPGHETNLASLHGCRFVTCSEVEEGQAFDESLAKDLTGGDPIMCRRMREDFWSYEPTHKLFLPGNHKPSVRGDDEGIWRRMRLVPWTVTIPEAERDGELPKKLALELPGILAWSARGCLEWQKAGLSTPAAVNEATGTYRSENDALGEFFRLSVRFESDVSIARKDLREAYESFCRENGNEPLGAKRFSGRLRERGVREGSVRKGQSVVNGWKNVRLLTDAERATATNWGGTPAVVHTNGSHVEPTPSPDNYEPARDDDDAPRAEMSQDTLSDWLATQGIRPKE